MHIDSLKVNSCMLVMMHIFSGRIIYLHFCCTFSLCHTFNFQKLAVDQCILSFLSSNKCCKVLILHKHYENQNDRV
jgi:hypothetical protein